MALEQRFDRVMADAAALLEDAIVHAPLDFEKHRGIRVQAIIPETQFEAVLVPIDRPPIESQVILIQVQAMDRIRVIRPPDAEFVHFQVAPDKIPHLKSGWFRDQVFQLEPLLLHSVSAHNQLFVKISTLPYSTSDITLSYITGSKSTFLRIAQADN